MKYEWGFKSHHVKGRYPYLKCPNCKKYNYTYFEWYGDVFTRCIKCKYEKKHKHKLVGKTQTRYEKGILDYILLREGEIVKYKKCKECLLEIRTD